MVEISSRSKKILYMMIATDDYIPLSHIQSEIKLSKRTVYYEICKINDWLIERGLDEIEIVRGKGIHLTPVQKEQIEKKIDDRNIKSSYVLSPMERVAYIICFIISGEKKASVEQLEELLDVSRNTIFNDLRVVVRHLQRYHLDLIYVSKQGYFIQGDTVRIRALFIMHFNTLRPIYDSGAADRLFNRESEKYLKRLEDIERKLNTTYVDGILLSLSVLIPIMLRGDNSVYFPDLNMDELQQQEEMLLIRQMFPEFSDKEQIYLCLHLLGSRVSAKSIDVFENLSNQSDFELAKALVAEFEKAACVIFTEREELEKALFMHFNESMYRFQYGIQVGNPMLEDIRREYPNLLKITRQISYYLEQQVGLPISEDEIAYLALHFGAYLQREKTSVEHVRILIICSNGIATGNMLRNEIIRMLPNAEIVGVISYKEAVNVERFCDIVILTVKIDSTVPVIIVNGILTDFDRKIIMNHSMLRKTKNEIDVEALYRKVSKYVKKEEKHEFRQALQQFFNESLVERIPALDKTIKGLADYLQPHQITIEDGSYSWIKALHKTGECLVQKGSIEKRYMDQIINQTHYYGPYMFIANGVVLTHAKPSDGVIRLDISMTIFKEPVTFSNLHNARIIMVMAAVDQTGHLKILNDIMTIFSDHKNIETLLNLESAKDIYQYIQTLIN